MRGYGTRGPLTLRATTIESKKATTDVEGVGAPSRLDPSSFLWLATSFIISRRHLICPLCVRSALLSSPFFLSLHSTTPTTYYCDTRLHEAKDVAIIHQNPNWTCSHSVRAALHNIWMKDRRRGVWGWNLLEPANISQLGHSKWKWDRLHWNRNALEIEFGKKKNEIGSKINPFGASALSDWAGAAGIIWKLIISHIGGPVDLSIYYWYYYYT